MHDYNPAYNAISAAEKSNKISQLYELAEGMGHSAKTNNTAILQLFHRNTFFSYDRTYNFTSATGFKMGMGHNAIAVSVLTWVES